MIVTMRQYWQVVATAWNEEREGAAARLHYDETAFLPAALEIMETPANPLGRTLLLSLCGMVLVALLWSIFGQVDIVVVSSGRTLPRDRVQMVSWGGSGSGLEGTTGVVRAIHVAEGDHVRRGQVLIELDPTISGADAAQAQRGLASAQADAARSRALVDYLQSGRLHIAMPSGLSADEAATQDRLIRSAIAEYEAKAGALRQARIERASELAAAITERQKLADMLVPFDKELAMRTELAAKGYQSKVAVYQLQQLRAERLGNMEVQTSAAAKARAAMAGIDQQLRELRQQLVKGSLSDLAKAGDDASLRREEITKADRRNALLQIRAPADGTVEQLQVHTIGGTVEPARPLMTIIPAGGELAVEAEIENRDIGFVRVGQPVAVKVDAFPFTEFGVLTGHVASIGSDAVTPAAAQNGPARSPVYVARVQLDRSTIMVGSCDRAHTPSADCRPVGLSAGMALQVEIKTGRRRIIEYLLSPLLRSTTEAARER